MSKRSSITVIAVFLAFLGLLLLLHVILPDRDFSERENRYLERFPVFSFSALQSGEFTKQIESYTADHFPFRDQWITLKALAELTAGRTENNGVFLCGDMLIEAFKKAGKPLEYIR